MRVSAAILIGAASFICFVVVGAAAGSDLLNRIAGAMAAMFLLGLCIYISMSVAKGLRDASEMFSPVIYGLAALALFLLGLFVAIWIIKRMWEAA